MTPEQITSVFLRAAEVDRKLPDTSRPARLKAMNMGYVHTFAEMNGWDEKEKHAANWAWLDPENLKATTNDVGIWEAAMELMKLVPDEKKRRALWAWAAAKAGGMPFAKWCRTVEGIQPMAGDWRKKSAIGEITRAFQRKPLQNNELDAEQDFTNDPEIEHKKPMIGVWRADDAVPTLCGFDEDLRDFSWAEAQNQRRRERQARKRQQAA